jgi:FAD-NAD(P)-binding
VTGRDRPAGHVGGREPLVLAVIGAGPSAVSFLERLGVNVPELLADTPIDVHLIDPFPPGAGRVWRYQQSPLLRMNSMAQDVTMFTDETVHCEGPIAPGPSLIEWAGEVGADGLGTGALTEEARKLTGTTFPTRRLQSAYLSWVYRQVLDRLPAGVTVTVHQARATDIDDLEDGTQLVSLEGDAAALVADFVVLALGHVDVDTSEEHHLLAAFARKHDLAYLPPAYSADTDLSSFRPGSTVLLRGMGLAAVDLTVLLTEGRGGTFAAEPDGTLRYHPSGQEPHLVLGSRRGVPYHAKLTYALQGPRPRLPRFFSSEAIDELLAVHDRLDFRRHVWPLLSKEIAWAYYHELFAAHPERTSMAWDDFDRHFEAAAGDSPELADIVALAVPGEVDRFDVARFDRPLDGVTFARSEEFQHHLRAYIEADLRRRSDPAYSADLGAFNALLACYGQLGRIVASGQLALGSRREDVDGWWRGFFSYFASGPPGHRLNELLALSRAGVVEFLGASMWVEATDSGRFRAGSPSSPAVIDADGLIEARLPTMSVSRARNALLRQLHSRGEAVEEALADDDDHYNTGRLSVSGEALRIMDRSGRAHPRRVALGILTNRPAAGTFSRPRTNAISFRQNDAVARSVLATLGRVDRRAAVR